MTGVEPPRPPGAQFAMSVIHPGSPTLAVRYRQGVLVTPHGFPDWPLCARAVVAVPATPTELTLDELRVLDVLAANLALAGTGDPLWTVAGPGRAVATPAGWCWAHVGGTGRPDPGATRQLALVPAELHGSYRHAGGLRTVEVAGRGLRFDPAVPAVRVGHGAGEEVPPDVLDVVERLLGWPLPPAYRGFLARTNGAGPLAPAVLPTVGLIVDQPLFGLARADQAQDLSTVGEWVRDRLTIDFLPIGYVQGGLLAVKVSGDDLDSIWYYDDDDPRDHEAFDAEDVCAHLLYRCADSIDRFWSALVEPPAWLVRWAEEWVGRGQVSEVRDEWIGAGLPARMMPAWQVPAPAVPAAKAGRDSLAALFEVR